MADQPPQERTVFIIAGLALTEGEEVRALICDLIDKIQRERGDLPIVLDRPPVQRPEVEPMGKTAEPTKSSPPVEPPIYIPDPNDPRNSWMEHINVPPRGPRPQSQPPAAGEPVASGAAAKEPPIYRPDPSSPRQQWELVVNKPPNGPRPPPPPPYRDPLDDPFGLYE